MKYLKSKITYFLIAIGFLGVAYGQTAKTIESSLVNKTQLEREEIKSTEIAKQRNAGTYISGAYEIEIQSVEAIKESQGGIQVFIRAWKDGKPVGFGSDGTVEIERVRIYNPPILVSDPNGTIERDILDLEGNVISHYYLREDPQEAVRQVIVQVIKQIGKSGNRIVQGKRGNTVSTLFPAAGANEPVDGFIQNFVDNGTWDALHDDTTASAVQPSQASAAIIAISADDDTNEWDVLHRSAVTFDTSVIGSDTISSAVLSIYGTNKSDAGGWAPTMGIYSVTLAATNNLALADYDQANFGSTLFASITYAAWSTTGYNDFTLNASGIAHINASGITQFGIRDTVYDVADSPPTWTGANHQTLMSGYFADQTGTSNDPMLVVEHAAGAAGGTVRDEGIIWFDSD